MARPVRLVNCSLVFLLVIRCIRAPGQRPTRLGGQRASERGQARMAPLCSRDNCHIGIGRHTFLTRDDPPATATCDAPASRFTAPAALRAARVCMYMRVCMSALARGTFLRAPGSNVPGHDRTIGTDVLTEHAAWKRASR